MRCSRVDYCLVIKARRKAGVLVSLSARGRFNLSNLSVCQKDSDSRTDGFLFSFAPPIVNVLNSKHLLISR